jgi:hypothetical protein
MIARRVIIVLLAVTFMPLLSFAGSGYHEDCYYETGDRISVTVSGQAIAGETQDSVSYSYSVSSNPNSVQNVWLFEIILPEKDIINRTVTPAGWGGPGWAGKPTRFGPPLTVKPPYAISWTAPEGNMKPSTTTYGFLFQTSYGLPGIVDFYVEGESIARCPEGMAVDFIPGYDDITPYGPGIVGKTVGPTAPPADFKPLDFLDYIISMKHEASSLGWIRNKGIEQSLDAKLENARRKIEQGDNETAKNILHAFVNEVEAQGCESYDECPPGKHLTSEAYALLKYNALYMIEQL